MALHRYPGLVARLDGTARERKEAVDVILAKAEALRAKRSGGAEGEGDRPTIPGLPEGIQQQRVLPPRQLGPPAGPSLPAPAGPAGPPTGTLPGKRDKKKDKKKEKEKKKKQKKKDPGTKTGTKTGKKKRKRSDSSENSTSSAAVPDDLDPPSPEELTPTATCYNGHFLHPSFGSQQIDAAVRLKAAAIGSWGETTGHWVIMGQVVDSMVTVTYEGKRVIFSDGTIMLDGTTNDGGIVKGEVLMGGVRGGSFILTPDENNPDAVELDSPSPLSDGSHMAEPVGGIMSSEEELIVVDEPAKPIARPSQPRPGLLHALASRQQSMGKAEEVDAAGASMLAAPKANSSAPPRPRGKPMAVKSCCTMARSKSKRAPAAPSKQTTGSKERHAARTDRPD
mmetsp:Transcript_46369/g.91965  ORF Transcript_46369/g.91965 Transcript_46369/m.91965 type:complete len:394 (-) Transcript_46369:197-1378(-)